MQDLTGFQRDLLVVIGGLNEPKGLDVNENLEEYYGSEIRHGRLYPNLDTLVDKGLVKKGKHDLRTNKYTLTDRGTREIAARLEWADRDDDRDRDAHPGPNRTLSEFRPNPASSSSSSSAVATAAGP